MRLLGAHVKPAEGVGVGVGPVPGASSDYAAGEQRIEPGAGSKSGGLAVEESINRNVRHRESKVIGYHGSPHHGAQALTCAAIVTIIGVPLACALYVHLRSCAEWNAQSVWTPYGVFPNQESLSPRSVGLPPVVAADNNAGAESYGVVRCRVIAPRSPLKVPRL